MLKKSKEIYLDFRFGHIEVGLVSHQCEDKFSYKTNDWKTKKKSVSVKSERLEISQFTERSSPSLSFRQSSNKVPSYLSQGSSIKREGI